MAAPKGNKFAEGNDGGRPTDYKEEYCDAIIEYFSIEPQREIEIPHYKGGEVTWVDKKFVANPLPKFHEFAKSIGVTHQTLHNWKDEHKEFFEAYKECKELQKWFLIENGLNANYNASAYIFTAKNITDMRDTLHNENTNNTVTVVYESEPIQAASETGTDKE